MNFLCTNKLYVATFQHDAHSRYRYNLFQLIAEVFGDPPYVVKNDEHDAATMVAALQSGHFGAVVISPGPGNPTVASDVGICTEILSTCHTTPILGVCLGHQVHLEMGIFSTNFLTEDSRVDTRSNRPAFERASAWKDITSAK